MVILNSEMTFIFPEIVWTSPLKCTVIYIIRSGNKKKLGAKYMNIMPHEWIKCTLKRKDMTVTPYLGIVGVNNLHTIFGKSIILCF